MVAASPVGAPVPPPARGAAARTALQRRVRSAIVCLGFAGLTLSQQPGRIVPDTKLDLAVDPWGFLGHALRMWDPQGFAGQVQNQAYGYLFPMGPFFGLGQAIGMPAWIVQRLWMALLLSVAFLGVMALARRLRIGTPEARLVGALAYALAPRMISGLGATSVEVLPMALAPWVLVPLVAGARGGAPRRAAALSGVAVFCVGGVNAVATAAVLPLGAIWLLTRPAGPRRRRLMGWWVASVALATAWWAGPLLLLGRYSPPFLDYIETASATTRPTGLLSALRGTTQWLAYLADPSGPIWPAGWALVHDTLPLLATVVLAAAGLLGLARADLPDRAWLVLGMLTGLGLVTLGHLGPVQGLLAAPAHTALDGVLAPLRNVHKFDPVLRLPLALGVTHLCGVLLRRGRRRPTGPSWWLRAGPPAARGALVGLVLALLATASPAVAGRLAPPAGFDRVPAYWQQTADWLAAARPSGRALLLPASSFGTYDWGTTGDEPLQPMARSPWEVRSAVPLTPPAHIRMLDAVEQRLAAGRGSAGLAPYLARAGISYLVVRNDLDAGAAGAPRSILVHRALADSPGLTRVAAFGPVTPGATVFLGRVLDSYLTAQRPAVEVFAVADPAPRAWTTPLSDAVSVRGGPDTVLALEDRGLLTGRPAILPDGTAPEPATAMVGDAQVRRERSFGRIEAAASAGLTAGDPLRLEGAARDYLYPGAALAESVVRIDGATVSASDSAADADNFSGTRPADQPYAALDGDPGTAWRSAVQVGRPTPVWWRIVADRLITARTITVRLADVSGGSVRLRITTDGGQRAVTLAGTTRPQTVTLPAGPTRSLTITEPGRTGRLALAEVAVPGLTVSRTVVTPAPDGPVAVYAFDAANPPAGGCVTQSNGRPRCSGALAHPAEEPAGVDRVFTVARPAAYAVTATATPRPGAALDALISAVAPPTGPRVTASSAVAPDPRTGADAAVDGDPSTAWIASAEDRRPSLTLRWSGARTVDRIRVATTADTAASTPTALGVSDGGLVRTVQLDRSGTARFAPITTDHLTLTFPLVDSRTSFDPYTRTVTPLGVGVSELEVDGLSARSPAAAVVVPCADGPVITVDGVARHTSVTTTLAALRALRPVRLDVCGDAAPAALGTGAHRLDAASTGVFAVDSVTLARPDAAGAPAPRIPAHVARWSAEDRVVTVAARTAPTLLVVPENVNAGWTATLAGRVLATRTVDGWQQAYVLPAGAAGDVHLVYRPGTAYRAALAGGAAAVLLLLAVLLVPARRPGPPPTGRRWTGAGTVLAAAGGTAMVGGALGLLVLGAVTAAVRRARGRRTVVLGILAGIAAAVSGIVELVGGAAAEPVVQTFALVALTSVVAAVLVTPAGAGRAGTRPRHRRRGRSTPR